MDLASLRCDCICLSRPKRPILVPHSDRGNRRCHGVLIGGVADVRYGWRLTIGSSDRGSHLRWAKEGIDDWDKLPSF